MPGAAGFRIINWRMRLAATINKSEFASNRSELGWLLVGKEAAMRACLASFAHRAAHRAFDDTIAASGLAFGLGAVRGTLVRVKDPFDPVLCEAEPKTAPE
jgi:hypothetical protein